jgi:hypothetical protein
MANGGWYGTAEEWKLLEAPLIGMDADFSAAARSFGLAISKNHKGWPERSVAWGDDIRCLIQLYLADPKALTWNFWICCSQDRAGERFWRREFLIEQQTADRFSNRLSDLLPLARQRLLDWSTKPDEFEFATKLASI